MDNEKDSPKSEPLFFKEENGTFDSFYIGKNAGGHLKNDIMAAKSSIKIISPFLGENEIENLCEKCIGGVRDIALITAASEDDLQKGYQIRALKKLYGKHDSKSSFCRCLFLKNNPVHTKLYIIDDKIAYTGSLNYTSKGLSKNHESCFKFKNEQTVLGLSAYFETLFKGNFASWSIAEIWNKIERFEQANKPSQPEPAKTAAAPEESEKAPPQQSRRGILGGFFKR